MDTHTPYNLPSTSVPPASSASKGHVDPSHCTPTDSEGSDFEYFNSDDNDNDDNYSNEGTDSEIPLEGTLAELGREVGEELTAMVTDTLGLVDTIGDSINSSIGEAFGWDSTGMHEFGSATATTIRSTAPLVNPFTGSFTDIPSPNSAHSAADTIVNQSTSDAMIVTAKAADAKTPATVSDYQSSGHHHSDSRIDGEEDGNQDDSECYPLFAGAVASDGESDDSEFDAD